MPEEPSLLDTMMQLGGTRLPTGGVEMTQSLIDQLGRGMMGHPGLEAFRQIMGSMAQKMMPRQTTNWYWDARHPKQGGMGQLIEALSSPGEGYYRLVGGIPDAEQAISAGETPLVYPGLRYMEPSAVDLTRLPRLQEQQYAAPGGQPLFLSGPGGLTLNPQHEWPAE